MSEKPEESSLFPRTDWAELGKAAEADEARLDRLIRLYWTPLKVFLIATFPEQKDQAEVWLQDFAQDKILKKGWLQRADRTRGKFRHFLKTSLKNFVLDRLERSEVKHAPVSLDDLEQEPAAPSAASEEFDLAWAQVVLEETLKRMEADCKNPSADQPRRGQIWEMFRIRVVEPAYHGAEQVAYEGLIERFGLKSPTDASNMLLTGKRIFKMHLNRVIQEYAEQDAATVLEIKALEEFLARIGKRG